MSSTNNKYIGITHKPHIFRTLRNIQLDFTLVEKRKSDRIRNVMHLSTTMSSVAVCLLFVVVLEVAVVVVAVVEIGPAAAV